MEPRVGFGLPDPALTAVLAVLAPAAEEPAVWGPLRLHLAAYLATPRLPDALVTSVRCLVRVDGRIVVTRSPDDVNIWPGGRREPGESVRETVVREVREETGCEVVAESLRPLGFLHAHHLIPPPDDYTYPHPDFLQLVFTSRSPNAPPVGWQDTDGWVQEAWLEELDAVRHLGLSPLALPFLDALGSST